MLKPLHKSFFIPLIIYLFTFQLSVKGQNYDTVYLKPNHALVSFDTIYFGHTDSVIIINDSVKYIVTKGIGKSMIFLQDYYRSVFIKDTTGYSERAREEFKKASSVFEPYKGKIIRSITFKQVQMFEGSVRDTGRVSTSNLSKSLNAGHASTKKWILRQNLRFKKNTELIPSIISENERLIRGLPYIEDAKIYVDVDPIYVDSIDLIIVTKDRFPIGVSGSISSISKFTIEPYTRNFLGFGHTLMPALIYNNKGTPSIGYGGEYVIPNFSGWFIRTKFDFENTYNRERYRVNISKPFVTNDVIYGGGLEYYRLAATENFRNYYLPDSILDTIQYYSMDNYDFWISRSFFIEKDNYSKFVNLSFRYNNKTYNNHPNIKPDSNYIFHDQNNFILSVSFNQNSFYKTSRLMGYGVTEDVPYGYTIDLLSGYQFNQFYKRFYIGSSASWTQNFDSFGYLAYQIGAGAFINTDRWEDIKLGSRIIYFSPYIEFRRFGIRHLVSPSAHSIINPRYSQYETFDNAIGEIKDGNAFGLSSVRFRYEPYIYTPYQILGLKIAFSVYGDIGWLSTGEYWTGNWHSYGAIGAGFHFKNESLTFPTFTFELGYYPKLGQSNNEFKYYTRFKDREIFKGDLIEKPEFYFDF